MVLLRLSPSFLHTDQSPYSVLSSFYKQLIFEKMLFHISTVEYVYRYYAKNNKPGLKKPTLLCYHMEAKQLVCSPGLVFCHHNGNAGTPRITWKASLAITFIFMCILIPPLCPMQITSRLSEQLQNGTFSCLAIHCFMYHATSGTPLLSHLILSCRQQAFWALRNTRHPLLVRGKLWESACLVGWFLVLSTTACSGPPGAWSDMPNAISFT